MKNTEVRGLSLDLGQTWHKGFLVTEGVSSSHLSWWSTGLLSFGGHVDHMIHHPISVVKFIVIPANELDTMAVKDNVSFSIKDERWGVTGNVTAGNMVLSTAQDAFGGFYSLPGSLEKWQIDRTWPGFAASWWVTLPFWYEPSSSLWRMRGSLDSKLPKKGPQ